MGLITLTLNPPVSNTSNPEILSIIACCFLLAIILTIIYLASNNRSNVGNLLAGNENQGNSNNPDNPDTISHRLFEQLVYNNANPRDIRAYNEFAANHPGHLDLDKRIRLSQILKSSIMANEYRYGSSIGIIYINQTYTYARVSPEMLGVVLVAENVSVPPEH